MMLERSGRGANGAVTFHIWLADWSWRWSEGCESTLLRWCQVRVCTRAVGVGCVCGNAQLWSEWAVHGRADVWRCV